jgi:polar amino acid transport system substrate-binding protein
MSQTISRRDALVGILALPATLRVAPVWAQAASAGSGLLARLQAAKSVTVGTTNFPPYSGINLDGTLTGVVPILTKTIMEKLGIPEVKAVATPFGELIPGLQAGRWDFIATALTITKARCTQVSYADPMISDGAAIISLKGQIDDPPKTIAELVASKLAVGVSTGGALSRLVLSVGVSPDNIRQVPDNGAMVDALVAKRIQVILQDYAGIKDALDKRKLPVDVTYPVSDAPKTRSSCAFRAGDTDLRDAFQKELRALKASGEFLAVSRQFGFDPLPEMLTMTADQACTMAE